MAARRAQQMQGLDLELLESTPDHEEIASGVAAARRRRAEWRALEERAHRDRIAQADAQRAHEAGLAERRRRFDNKTAAAAERAWTARDTSTTLTRLAFAQKYLPALALIPAVVALVVGAVNVAGELSRINPATAWVNWAVEPLFTGCP